MPEHPLHRLHQALLVLHKALLEFEKQQYESIYGKIPSPNEYLNLVIKHPAFAWLRSLSEAIVSTDGLDKEGDRKPLPDIITSLANLLTPHPEGSDFAKKYDVAIQHSPEVAHAHSLVVKELKNISQ